MFKSAAVMRSWRRGNLLLNVRVKSKDAHAHPGLTPGHLTIFFLVKLPTMRALSLVKQPPPQGLFRGQMPCPRAEATKPRLISGNMNEVFSTAISIIFCIPFQRLRSSSFFLCTQRPPRVQVRAQCVRNIGIVCFKIRSP